MNIMVCVKQVQDNAVLPKLDPTGSFVVKEGVETMVSPFDLNAVEAALQLTEKYGGEVSVITAGDDTCKTALRIALSMGVSKAYLVSDKAMEGSDTFATSYALAKAIQSIGTFDLVFCGKQAIDDDAAQVGEGIAEQLGISQITYVNEIREASENEITAKRVGSAGEEVVQAKLPAVLTFEKSINEPRYPTLKRTRMANRAEIPVIDCQAAGADTGKVGANSPSAIVKLYTPAPRTSGEILKGDAEEIGKLAVQKLIEGKVV